MAFDVVQGCVRKVWVPMDTTSTPTLYKGQLVKITGDGVGAMAIASGAADTSNLQTIFGVVLGFNNRTPASDSVGESATAVITQAAQVARNFVGAEGFYPKSDPQVMVEVAVINANTILKAPLYNSTSGTAPTVLTVTTGSTTGLGFTSNACDMTPVANYCTSYCRSGANMGLMRISGDTSTTVETNAVAFPQDIAIGDTFVRVGVRPHGPSRVQLNSTSGSVGMFFDISVSPATNYFSIDVLGLDLKTAGSERVIFTFAPAHFDGFRA